MFREALVSGFYGLQAARDEYRLTYKENNQDNIKDYNQELVWRFIDVQTRLLAPICPHYAEFLWREILKKEGFVVKAGWPTADALNLTLQSANKYLQDSIDSIRKLLEKKIPGSKKANKQGALATALKGNKITCLIFVNEQFDGWKAECLSILQNKFNRDTRTFAPHSEILEAIQQSFVGQSFDFKQIQKICNPFLKFKKDEAIALGEQSLDLRLPFGEIEVLRENKDFIKRQISSKDLVVQDVEILSAADADSVANAGSSSSLNQNPPSPGVPAVIFLTQ